MSTKENQAIQSGADHVDQTQQLAHGYSTPHDESAVELTRDEPLGAPAKTVLANLTLTMFTQGASTRVRVGNPHNAAELYELAFDSPEEANTAMLDAGILTPEQVPDPTNVAGTGIALENITLEQLQAAGIKRHETYTG